MTHDSFVHINEITQEERENGGERLHIHYHCYDSPFGKTFIASTPKGICYLAFGDDEDAILDELRHLFPKASYLRQKDELQLNAFRHFSEMNWNQLPPVTLHIKGSPFQMRIWEELLKIPFGKLSTYQELANRIDNPNASRAVGSAVGANPVSFLIPCHRIVRTSGALGGYHWGLPRKVAMIDWETAQAKLLPE